MTIGRNDACPCGSGKKYKKCCLTLVEPDTNSDEYKKQKWSQVQRGLIPKIMREVEREYGPMAIHEAWDEFHVWENDDDGFGPDSSELPVFMPWFFYKWIPDDVDTTIADAPLMPPAMSLLDNSRNLSEDEETYLDACLVSTFSFFEVLEVNLNHSLKLKNILTEEYYTVLEKSATHTANKGDILFGQVVSVDDIDLLEATAPVIIRPIYKKDVIKLRQVIYDEHGVVDLMSISDFYIEILELYHFIVEHMINPPEPILTNTDGDLFVQHTMKFQISDPQKVFDALHALCFNEKKEELLEEAKFDKEGHLVEVNFPWLKRGNKKHKSWKNTVMGHIEINNTTMTVTVNSKERWRKFKLELNKRLEGSEWTLLDSKIETADEIRNKPLSAKEKLQGRISSKKQEELMSDPQVIAHFEKMMKGHWESWLVTPLPILNNKSPVEAVKTKDDREILESLLVDFERHAINKPMPGQNIETFKNLRMRLGM